MIIRPKFLHNLNLVKKMKIYLSGKISGLADLNVPKFTHYERLLKALNHEVVNPHNLQHSENSKWLDFMRTDLKAMLDCDMIAVLDDWQDSRGAMIEVLTFLDLGLPVVYASSLALGITELVKIDSKEVVFS
jgi:nucleoside 2-deoxyribosyltransferase